MDLFLMTNTTSGREIAGLSAETNSEPCQTSKMELSAKKIKKVTSHCIICGHRIHKKAFLNWLCQYLSLLNVFFNRLCAVEMIISTIIFSQYFFSIDFPRWKSMLLPHFVYFVIQPLTISTKKLHLRFLTRFRILFWPYFTNFVFRNIQPIEMLFMYY